MSIRGSSGGGIAKVVVSAGVQLNELRLARFLSNVKGTCDEEMVDCKIGLLVMVVFWRLA